MTSNTADKIDITMLKFLIHIHSTIKLIITTIFFIKKEKKKLWLSAASVTDIGLTRGNNEDNVRILPGKECGIFFAILADGMGGHVHGEIASEMAIKKAIEMYTKQVEKHNNPSRALKNAYIFANHFVWQFAQDNNSCMGMGTTLCSIAFHENKYTYAWVGDSRIYFLRNGTLMQLTEDDTVVNKLVKQGILTQEQANTHPDSHILCQAIGTQAKINEVHVMTAKEEYDLGDIFLITSDGIHDTLSLYEIQEILVQNQSKDEYTQCQVLIDAAKIAGSTDNLSAIVVRAHHIPNKNHVACQTRY